MAKELSREEQIAEASEWATDSHNPEMIDLNYGFEEGAKWADSHPIPGPSELEVQMFYVAERVASGWDQVDRDRHKIEAERAIAAYRAKYGNGG